MIRILTRGAEALPDDAEVRLQDFTELVAAALSNAQASRDLNEIATAQAALRRVATLVAEGAEADELLSGVAAEVAQVLGVSGAEVDRYEADGTSVVLATWRDAEWEAIDSVLHVGMRFSPDPGTLTEAIQSTGHSARIDDYTDVPGLIGESSRTAGIGAACAAPIVVDGKLWGAIRAFSREEGALAADAESRLEGFTELVATAISNAQAHGDLAALADEQAALRRLATLVAQGAESGEVFDAVCAEAGQLISAASVNLSRYTPDGLNVTMAGWSLRDMHIPVGTSFPIAPDTVGGAIVATGEPVRMDSWNHATSELAVLVRDRGARSSVGAPVVVEGRLWGGLVAATDGEEPLPAGTELRLARFTELIATAISNATTQTELIASRARIVAAGDEARRRIERDLHDGTQQRLIAVGLDLQRVRAAVPAELSDVRDGIEQAGQDLEAVLEDVRELSRGLRPPMLSRRGLRPSLLELARRSPVPVELDVELTERPHELIETAVYYVVAEALANANRHSNASTISVRIAADSDGSVAPGRLHATVADDGDGGAAPMSGLVGLADRIDVLGGRFELDSPPGRGTTITVTLPLTPPAVPEVS
jgi:signal transduction histidine kinase